MSISILYTSVGNGAESDEVSLRAAIVVAMLRYTRWPTRDDSPLIICAYGSPISSDKLAEAVQTATYIRSGASYRKIQRESEAKNCDVIVLGDEVKAILDPGNIARALIVCDGCIALQNKSTAILRLIDRSIKFEINLHRAKKARIDLSSDLLSLALVVRREDVQ